MKTAARSYHRHMAWASAIAFSLAVLLAVAVRSSGEDLALAGKTPGHLDVSLAELMQVKLTAEAARCIRDGARARGLEE